jgi:uncharacterized protein
VAATLKDGSQALPRGSSVKLYRSGSRRLYGGGAGPAANRHGEGESLAINIFCSNIKYVEIEFDPDKRARTIAERGLEMARANEIFERRHISFADDRANYGEPRAITVGWLDARMVVVVWTPRGGVRRVISLRKANDREQAKFAKDLG